MHDVYFVIINFISLFVSAFAIPNAPLIMECTLRMEVGVFLEATRADNSFTAI